MTFNFRPARTPAKPIISLLKGRTRDGHSGAIFPNDELIVSQANARLQIKSLQRQLDRLTAQTGTNEVVITVTPPGM